MADVILFRPNEKIIKNGTAIKIGNPGRAIGRPRTRAPRKAARADLNLEDLRQLNARPLGVLPAAPADETIAPSQRLSFVQRVRANYREQQPKITQAVIARRDKVVHSETVLDNWRVEIWETRGTEKPCYFYRTESLIIGARGGQSRRGKYEYSTPQECLRAGREKAADRERLWRARKATSVMLPAQRRRLKRRWNMPIYPVPAEAAAICERSAATDLPDYYCTCPICQRTICRNRNALRSHFRPHVSKGLLRSRQVDELLSFLVAS